MGSMLQVVVGSERGTISEIVGVERPTVTIEQAALQ